MAKPTELHPALEPVSFLIGTWTGTGRGFYPTISEFGYEEESRFWSTGRPVLHYEQLTTNAETGSPLHCESGFVRVSGDKVEFVIAHPLGIVEVEEGTVKGCAIELATVDMGYSSTAEPVSALARRIEVGNDVLVYSLAMKAVGQSLQGHLEASLTRA
jgi:hypothetical protein